MEKHAFYYQDFMKFVQYELEQMGCKNIAEMGEAGVDCVKTAINNIIQKFKENALLHNNQQQVDESHPFIKIVHDYGNQLLKSLNNDMAPQPSAALKNIYQKLGEQSLS